MWKYLLVVSVVLAATPPMALAALLTVGFSQVGSESGWHAAETNMAGSETEKRGTALKIADGQQKQGNQAKAARSFVTQGVDTIFTAPMVVTGWEPVLKGVRDAEIPIFLLDHSIDMKDKSLYMTIVIVSNTLEGKPIGDWLVEEVNGEPYSVIGLQDTVGVNVAIGHKKGPAEAIKNALGIKTVRSQSGDFTHSRDKEAMGSSIKAKNNDESTCMVYTHSDDMVIGAVQATKEAGLKPGRDVLTGSIDGMPDIYKAMIDGEANVDVELTLSMIGSAFDMLGKYKKDGIMSEKLTLIKSTLYLPDTAKGKLEKKENIGY